MLKKLLKYELKATARIFLPLYAVLLSVAIVNRFLFLVMNPYEWETPRVLSMIVFISIMVGMFVITFFMMIQRFYQNLLSQEGYLMFTLPAETWKHIICKLLVSMMWIVASVVVAMMSILIISATQAGFAELLLTVKKIYAALSQYLDTSTLLFFLEILLLGLVTLASGVLIFYASIAIGHLFNRHRIVASIGAFIGLSTVTQVLMTVATSLVDISVDVPDLAGIVPAVHLIMLYSILLMAIPALGYFFLTGFVLNRHLNLE